MRSACCDADTVDQQAQLHFQNQHRRSRKELKYGDQLKAKHARMVEQHHRTIAHHQGQLQQIRQKISVEEGRGADGLAIGKLRRQIATHEKNIEQSQSDIRKLRRGGDKWLLGYKIEMSKIKGDYVGKAWVKEKVQAAMTELQQKHREAIQLKNEAIQKQKMEYEDLVETNKACIEGAEKLQLENKELEGRVNEVKKQLRDLLSLNSQLSQKSQKKQNELQKQIRGLQAEVQDLKKENESTHAENEQKNRELAKKKQEIEQLQELSKQLEDTIEKEQKIKAELQTEAKELRQERDSLKLRLEEQAAEYLKKVEEVEAANNFRIGDDSMSLSKINQFNSSVRSDKSYSFEIENLFRNYSQDLLEFMNSVPGESQPAKPEDRGDMTCVFVSKDRLSMDRYNRVNRSFLKTAIKAEEKRFRFVIIHKPDKAEKPKKLEKPAKEKVEVIE